MFGDHAVEVWEPNVQELIKNTFWPGPKSSMSRFDSYLSYFQWTIRVLAWPGTVVDTADFAIHTYGDLTTLVMRMKVLKNCSRIEMALELQDDFPISSRDQILRSMDLTARLWLTLHVRSVDLPLGPHLSEMTEIDWPPQTSLTGMVANCFPKSNQHKRGGHIDAYFTVQKLHELCRVRVQWTANLQDHLKYDQSTRTLYIFPHAICWESHLESDHIFPRDLVRETMKTLDLLFPQGDEATRKYLLVRGQTSSVLSDRFTRPSDLAEFCYWRHRLTKLHDLFDQPPQTIREVWHDRRDPVRWWTFWLTIVGAIMLQLVMTLAFGVISSYTGYRQAYFAEKAYQLQVWQACSQNNPPAEICKT